MSNENHLIVITPAPHIHSGLTVRRVMSDVLISLLPASLAGVYFFGLHAAALIVVCVGFALLSEYIWQKYILKIKTESSISDMSAAVTGLLLALTLPPSLPLWQAAVGSIFAIIFSKQIFGGLGHNPFNPALAGRAFLQIAWPLEMTSWTPPFAHGLWNIGENFHAVTSATPLAALKYHITDAVPTIKELFIGNVSGSLGETSALALLVGAFYLIYRRHIKLMIPLAYIATVAVLSVVWGSDVLYQLFSGGLILGAFFMATDPVTAPSTFTGGLIFGAGCGLLTSLIRFKGGFPEGVCFSILIMNVMVPLIDRWTIPKPFGYRKKYRR